MNSGLASQVWAREKWSTGVMGLSVRRREASAEAEGRSGEFPNSRTRKQAGRNRETIFSAFTVHYSNTPSLHVGGTNLVPSKILQFH